MERPAICDKRQPLCCLASGLGPWVLICHHLFARGASGKFINFCASSFLTANSDDTSAYLIGLLVIKYLMNTWHFTNAV